jgi:lysophospholipid acyltransferase (LPLAT)-like uncharacterized protein
LPAPFARIVIVVGEPIMFSRELSVEQINAMQTEMSAKMLQTYKIAQEALNNVTTKKQ